ncbi:hypothetical protein [Meridianimaribacter flavus]|uniref:Abortive phage resistance protein AbiGi (Putative antitoxin) n=1 Tax=Meridianimaribacter flavus TaxID=571115 RepID=A0ABY2G5W1_9FLAO|nr:hypothetical protein [Meridianimaribacter flavus]TDY12431.1 abortive phage resistance protein AbiGi (putative antitoxin) [Meridianimaribacter flavus]
MIQNTSIIRFVEKLDFLKDDLVNGFELKKHKVSFQSTLSYNCDEIFEIWKENNISNQYIRRLRDIKDLYPEKNQFLNNLVKEFESDNRFKWEIIHLIGSVNFEVPMKCFTEIRHNQKLHPLSVGFFGSYGIQLTKKWAIENNASQVIYIDTGLELSKRLGLICSLMNSLGGKYTQNALFDFLSLVEIGVNSYEFEWRIVGNHGLFKKDKTNQSRIKFELNDILGIYVPKKNEAEQLKSWILDKIDKKELFGLLPNIFLTQEVLLSKEEMDEIEKIKRRND